MIVNRLETGLEAGDGSSNLGAYLRDRRARLDPAALGFVPGRRRTPGLRREEVAQRASISPAWYTWLEQGRGGAPSPEVLSRIADGLLLNETERAHLFFLALGRAPIVAYKEPEAVTQSIQRLADAMAPNLATIRTGTWDVIAWNAATTLVMIDYAALPPTERNILKLTFRDAPRAVAEEERDDLARLLVNAFRADVARTGAVADIDHLVAELSAMSAQFQRLWNENDVRQDDPGTVRLHHPVLGMIALAHYSLAIDGRDDLRMIVHVPVDPAVREQIRALLDAQPGR